MRPSFPEYLLKKEQGYLLLDSAISVLGLQSRDRTCGSDSLHLKISISISLAIVSLGSHLEVRRVSACGKCAESFPCILLYNYLTFFIQDHNLRISKSCRA